jgi:hypothetical protein
MLLFLSLTLAANGWEWDQPPLSGGFASRVGAGGAGFLAAGRSIFIACGGEGSAASGCDRLVPSSSWAVTPVVPPAKAAATRPYRYDHALGVLGNYVILFGGCGGGGAGNCSGGDTLGDVEAWDWGTWRLNNDSAMQLTVAPRWGHTSTALTGGGAGAGSPCAGATVTGCLLIWGGVDAAGRNLAEFARDPDAPSLLALVLREEPAPRLELFPKAGAGFLAAQARGPVPPPRHYHAAAAHPGGGALLVSGGFSLALGAGLSDLWQLDVSVFPWVWSARAPPPGGAPPPLFGHKLLAAGGGWLLLFGGAGAAPGAPPLLLASPAFAVAANGSMGAWAAPAGVDGAPPAAGFRTAAVMLDVNSDGFEELVVLGGAACASGCAPTAQLSVLYGIGEGRATAAQELPWVLGGAGVAVVVLGALGYGAYKQRVGEGGRGVGVARLPAAARLGAAYAAAGGLDDCSPLMTETLFDYGNLERDGGVFEGEGLVSGGDARAGALPVPPRPRSLSQARRYAAGAPPREKATPKRSTQKGLSEQLEAGLSLMGEAPKQRGGGRG